MIKLAVAFVTCAALAMPALAAEPTPPAEDGKAQRAVPRDLSMARVSPTDTRVRTRLDALGLKYAVSPNGRFQMVFKTGEERTQIVVVESRTSKLVGVEIREVSAPAVVVKGALGEALARQLLEHNDAVKIGAWRIRVEAEETQIIFSAQIAAETDNDTLAVTIQAVAETADKLERDVTGKDEW